MNRLSGAEAVVRMLQRHGVEYIFGLCGDTSLPWYDALARLDHGMTHVLSRDERSAAYMADGYARVTGKVGICEGPSGGGATYILPGVAEANDSSIPLLAITTDVSVAARGRFALTELDQTALFRPVTKWNTVVDTSDQVAPAIRTAFQHMTTGRPGAAHIGLPFDVQTGGVDEDDIWADAELGRYPARAAAPNAADVERAARVLAETARPVIVCGGGPVIAGAFGEVRALAGRLGAPVATSISGQGIVADDHPLALGVVGSNGGTPETREVLAAADTVVFIGCRAGSVTTERWRVPGAGQRIVHIDGDPTVVGRNYDTAAAVVGDARLAVEALHEAIGGAPGDRLEDATKAVRKAKQRKFERFRAHADSNERPVRPERIVAALRTALPGDALVVADPGTPCPYVSAYYEADRAGRTILSNRAHGALGYALPAAVGAQLGRPQAKVAAVMGDGSFGFVAGELETVVRLGLPITLVVVSNASFGWIKAGQKHGFGERYYSVDFGRTDHAAVARAYGLKAWRVEDPAALAGVLKEAVAADAPALVDVISQPLQEADAPVSEWIA